MLVNGAIWSVFEYDFSLHLLHKNNAIVAKPYISHNYGHLWQMQSMQKAVQLTTFYVKSKEKNKCSFFQKNAIVYVIWHVFMVDLKIWYCRNYFNKEVEFAIV